MSTSPSQKRSIEDEEPARPARKRARKACVECHNRKIRCDLYLRGSPCTNCEEDGQHCVLHVRKGKRSKAEPGSYGPMQDGTQLSTGASSEPIPHQGHPQATNGSNAAVIPSGPGTNPPDPSAISSYHMYGNMPNHFQTGDVGSLSLTDMQGMSSSLPPNAIPLLDTDFSQFVDLEDMFGPPHALPSQYADSWGIARNDLLSDSVESPLVRIGASPSSSSQQSQLLDTMDWSSADKVFLKSQGASSIPSSVALHRLMQVYFQYVHPNLPIIDEGDFWNLWPPMSESGFRLGSFSLFVLQAMCHAASSFANDEIAHDCGFTNITVARENFHRRAKLLFDFGYEQNPLHLSQGALLLTSYVRKMDRLRRNSHWLTNAILYAHVAFGDRSSLQIPNSQKREKMLKRLWWCAILRDRIMPLGLRRPIFIRNTNIGFSYLTEADFEDELGRSKVHDPNTQSSIFQMICATCQLADALTPALSQMFSTEKPQERVRLSPDELLESLKEVRKNVDRLLKWKEATEERFPSPIGLGDTHSTVAVFANLMFIYCNAAIMGLCHHGMLLWESRSSSTPMESYYDHVPYITEAMESTTDRVKELVQLGLIHKTPLSLAAYLTFPLLMHAISAKRAAGTTHEGTAGRQLEIYLRAMRFQQSVYDAADFAYGMVEKIMVYAEDCRVMGSQRASPDRNTESESNHSGNTAPPAAMSGVVTWKDLLKMKPRIYLRLVMHVDLAFCSGIAPDEEDFPPQLRLVRTHS